MKQYIYADNAATTKLDSEAFEAMIPWLTENYGNASQPYSFGKKASRAIKEARETIANCIHAEPEQIFFTSGGTESDNWAIKCFGIASSKRILVTSPIEHHAILNSSRDANLYEVQLLSVNQFGEVFPEDLGKTLDLSQKAAPTSLSVLTSIMMANNEIGTIQPIKALAEVSHQRGVPFHTDAVQAVGHIPIDVNDLGVDLLSASAHKFNGPKGIGFLFDRGNTLFSYNSGGAQEKGRRAGTENVAAIVGMAVALRNNCAALQKNMQKINGLEHAFLELLTQSGLDFIRNGAANHVPGNISLSFKNADGEAILHRLDLMGICISTGSACDSVNTQISHVIQAIGVPEEYAKGTIRVSFGKNNTEEECLMIANALTKVLSLRNY